MSARPLSRAAAAMALASLLWTGPAPAQDYGSLEEAQAMAEQAVALFHSDGAEAAFTAFNTAPAFHDRDLYVFVIDTDGTMAAHGANETLRGRNILDLRDPSGSLFVREFLDVEEADWVAYQWQNPQTGLVEHKTSYIVNVGDYVIGVGAYQP